MAPEPVSVIKPLSKTPAPPLPPWAGRDYTFSMTNAQKARQEALAMLFELYSPEHQQHGLRFVHSGGWGSNVIGIKQNILKLAPLGRTDRWQHTLARWVSMVDDAHTPQTLRWAFIQGSVYASHAS